MSMSEGVVSVSGTGMTEAAETVGMAQRLTSCVCCGGDDLVVSLDLGVQPLPNAYHLDDAPPARFPLQLARCRSCSHSQLTFVTAPELRARHDVLTCGVDRAAQRHQRALAEDVVTCMGPSHVLDVGCGDGNLLEELRRLGCRVTGADRSHVLRRLARGKGIAVLDQPWGEAAAQALRAADAVPFNLVVATTVLGQVSDPAVFLRACKAVLSPGGMILVEVPYAGAVTPRHALDLPHHDRVSYFLVRSLTALVERACLEVAHVTQTDLHGGSIRLLLRVAAGTPQHAPMLQQALDEERRRGLHEDEACMGTQERVDGEVRAVGRLLADARRAGRRLVVYGATPAGNVLLERLRVRLDLVVDPDPLKHELRCPGGGGLVAHPHALIDERSDVTVLVVTWDAVDEVREELAAMRCAGDALVLCAPAPVVVDAATGEPVVAHEEHELRWYAEQQGWVA